MAPPALRDGDDLTAPAPVPGAWHVADAVVVYVATHGQRIDHIFATTPGDGRLPLPQQC